MIMIMIVIIMKIVTIMILGRSFTSPAKFLTRVELCTVGWVRHLVHTNVIQQQASFSRISIHYGDDVDGGDGVDGDVVDGDASEQISDEFGCLPGTLLDYEPRQNKFCCRLKKCNFVNSS